jgi:pyrroline-5-carboxylate reductase
MKVLVIGGGNMRLTYAEGMAASVYLNRRKLMIQDIGEQTLAKIEADARFEAYKNLDDCLPTADIVFLAVKPYHCEELFSKMRPMVNSNQLIVSLVAGLKIETIQNQLGINKIVRTMPNLPAKVRKGITSFTESKDVSRVELLMVRNLLDTTGASIHVTNENFIDKSTGISGSGPAYVFYFMQSMMEAARKMGFSENDSKELVSHTFEGAVELFNQGNISPAKWMDKVLVKEEPLKQLWIQWKITT